jgi:hypothetical protein
MGTGEGYLFANFSQFEGTSPLSRIRSWISWNQDFSEVLTPSENASFVRHSTSAGK